MENPATVRKREWLVNSLLMVDCGEKWAGEFMSA
jgi:hypothetical protein